ncbi:HNH endonuclease [Streptomyces sp. WAC 00631]|uniref:HNH endonuclease signature motif containing protein n=1 Tax=Streptomyces sp. WAC 00631 TaxID=2203201 RepID=UPI001E4B1826|nr:HNH endonuclease signature motif containing protein [Streptomyces sp. WAC 00631]MCC5035162.1 HNH endonuclease [Streptomyces sp. WAC 00631]
MQATLLDHDDTATTETTGPPEQPVTADEWAAHLASATPGPQTAAMLALLEREQLSTTGRIDALKAWERHVAWIQAQQVGLLADIEADALDATPNEVGWVDYDWNFACEDVACALKLSGNTAADRLAVATALEGRFPTTVSLLERGEICYLQAKAVAEVTGTLDPEAAGVVEAMVAPKMPAQSVGQTRRALNRAVLKADPLGAERRHRRRREDRTIWHRAAEDGMATWTAFLPTPQAAQLDAAVDAHAATFAEDGRTLNQKRVDALYDLVVNRPTGMDTPAGGTTPGGRSAAVVQVTVSLDTLIGVDEEPGQLKGYGPVSATAAREVAFAPGTIWRRLITHPKTGLLVKTDPTTYKPTADTQRHVIARDMTCTFPSCQMPAHRCDLDHIQPFDHENPTAGGRTEPGNLMPLCRRHHLLKHRTRWQAERNPDTGEVTWTAPTGHTYTNPPHTPTPTHIT